MQTRASAEIRRADFIFKNSTVRIIANRNNPEIKLAGISVGPFEEGNEYEVFYWVAKELEKSGIAHLREDDCIDSAKLYKIQWKERAQTAGQISKPADDFYPKLRRCIRELRHEPSKTPEKVREYERVTQLAQDIVNSRLKKIVSLAAAPAQTEHTVKNLTNEEKFLYEQLSKLIQEWRTQIIECEETEE